MQELLVRTLFRHLNLLCNSFVFRLREHSLKALGFLHWKKYVSLNKVPYGRQGLELTRFLDLQTSLWSSQCTSYKTHQMRKLSTLQR